MGCCLVSAACSSFGAGGADDEPDGLPGGDGGPSSDGGVVSDAAAPDADAPRIDDGGPTPDAAGWDGVLRAFVTSSTFTVAELGADPRRWDKELCTKTADNAGLAGRYVAWMSKDGSNARDRLGMGGPWVLLNGVIVAQTQANLTGGSLGAPINVDENGMAVGGSYVWTGTLADGTAGTGNAPAATCEGWTSSLVVHTGIAGWSGHSAAETWASREKRPCNNTTYRLYCFQQPEAP